MSTAKGQGVTIYVNPTTVTTNTAYILCAVSNEGGGVESDVIDVEPCLQDGTLNARPKTASLPQSRCSSKKRSARQVTCQARWKHWQVPRLQSDTPSVFRPQRRFL
jgi:hypothetical protein